jgi:hypothetical protein
MNPANKLHQMLFAIGTAIYEWQFVERALLGVLQAPFTDTAHLETAFFQLQGTGRLRFIDAVFEDKLDPEQNRQWVRLREGWIKGLTKDRNAFAHHEIDCEDIDGPVLRPSYFDRARYVETWEPKEEPYYTEDIWESVRAFQHLTHELQDFAEAIHRDEIVREARKERLAQTPRPYPESLPQSRRIKANHQRTQRRKDEARRAMRTLR